MKTRMVRTARCLDCFGDDPNDYMAKCGVKSLHKNGVNALCMSPGKKNYSHVNMPLEHYAAAIAWLKAHGTRKIGVMGMSTAGEWIPSLRRRIFLI